VARIESEADGGGLFVAEARTRQFERGGGSLEGDHPGSPFRDEELISWLERWVDDETLVAIDAPLSLPVCVRCNLSCPGMQSCEVPVVQWMRRHASSLHLRRGRTDPGKPHFTPYTQRATELLLERLTLQPREALGQGMGPLAARATYLRRALEPRLVVHENFIEVHPRASLLRRFGPDRERGTRVGDLEDIVEARKRVLEDLADGLRFDRVWPELVVRRVQVFHAVVAAFSALGHERADRPAGPAALDGGADSALIAALDDLGDLWREDGWIFTS
jgi:predicted nuclease with RNAse H fold